MKTIRKTIALLLSLVLLSVLVVSCSKATAQNTGEPQDPQEYKEEFLATVDTQYIDELEGVINQNILETTDNVFVSANYPQASANEVISAEIKSFVEKQITDFKEEVSTTEQNDFYKYMLTYKPFINGNVFSVKFSKNSYTGKIDRKNYVDGFVYDLSTGGKLELTDVFDSSTDYLNTIATLTKEYLQRNEVLLQNMDEALFTKGTAPEIQNYSNFVVCNDKVMFYFNRNTIAPGEVGTLEVSIPLESLNAMLNPNFLPLLATATPTATEGQAQDPLASPSPSGEQTGEATGGAVSAEMPKMLIPGDKGLSPFSIEGLDINDKYIALTFDDGPSPDTPHLLQTLKDNNAVATFFVVGEMVTLRPEIVKSIVDSGNELANHSYNHLDYKKNDFMAEVSQTDDAIEKIVGKRTILGRPPGGSVTPEIAEEIGRIQVLWDVDTKDWKHKDPPTVVKNVLEGAHDGAVVLMHDLHPTTVKACDTIIPELAKQGYKFVTVSQMIQIAQARGQEIESIFHNGKKST